MMSVRLATSYFSACFSRELRVSGLKNCRASWAEVLCRSWHASPACCVAALICLNGRRESKQTCCRGRCDAGAGCVFLALLVVIMLTVGPRLCSVYNKFCDFSVQNGPTPNFALTSSWLHLIFTAAMMAAGEQLSISVFSVTPCL